MWMAGYDPRCGGMMVWLFRYHLRLRRFLPLVCDGSFQDLDLSVVGILDRLDHLDLPLTHVSDDNIHARRCSRLVDSILLRLELRQLLLLLLNGVVQLARPIR